MRKKLLFGGAKKLEYEIRNIVQKADEVAALGQDIFWENIGDPIQKHAKVPEWIKQIVSELAQDDSSYGYCDSKGVLETRQFLSRKTNDLGGTQISSADILFFNGLGDAISKVYRFLPGSSRVIGPSPAYSTHSSSEAALANSEPLTYKLDPENNWYPDLEDLYYKIKYNPNVVGILIINPDNPTGMVYLPSHLKRMVEIAKEFDLFLICDEIYGNILLGNSETLPLSQVIGDVPGISMKGISKEVPWPGSRCGWMEFYNRKADKEFDRFCLALEHAKMMEVCSTTLPQKAIPKIFSHPKYQKYLAEKNKSIQSRSKIIAGILGDLEQITFVETRGAFYNTIIFKKGVLKAGQAISTERKEVQSLLDKWITDDMAFDKRFVYYLLATKGVCVVPLSSFHSDLYGFRVTLLEENEDILTSTFSKIRKGIEEYCGSV